MEEQSYRFARSMPAFKRAGHARYLSDSRVSAAQRADNNKYTGLPLPRVRLHFFLNKATDLVGNKRSG